MPFSWNSTTSALEGGQDLRTLHKCASLASSPAKKLYDYRQHQGRRTPSNHCRTAKKGIAIAPSRAVHRPSIGSRTFGKNRTSNMLIHPNLHRPSEAVLISSAVAVCFGTSATTSGVDHGSDILHDEHRNISNRKVTIPKTSGQICFHNLLSSLLTFCLQDG